MDSQIKLLQLSSYVRPKVKETSNFDWVLNGKKNWFYEYIIERKTGSVTNSAIINAYVDLIYGKGLSAKNTAVRMEDFLKLKEVLKPKDLHRIISDFALFGEASFEVIQTRGRKLSSINHVPKQKVVPNKVNENNEIEFYWYCDNWENTNQNVQDRYQAFVGSDGDAKQMYVIKPYQAGNRDYFSDPSWLACAPYCEMEEELANLNINAIKQNLSAGYIINIPDGKSLTNEEKDAFEKKIRARLTGSPNAMTFVLSFNGRDAEVNITPFPQNENIHQQWQWLTESSRQQIITGHRLTSPLLAGISTGSGFSSTADEMEMAEQQLMKRVISPMQNHIINALEEVLKAYDINLDLFLIPLTEQAHETPTELSKVARIEATEQMATELIEFGEDLTKEEWVLLSSADVDYATDDDIYDLIQLATTGTARPNAKSEQDSKDIRIRYRYVGKISNNTRTFCQLMVKANKLYRKEDIIQMGNKPVNAGFGLNGTDTYSIWLWKGGGRMSDEFPNGTCKHKWQREIYLKRGGGVDVNSPLAETISTSEARRRGYKVPVNDSDVSIAPHNNK